MNLKITRWHNHYELKMDGRTYIRYEKGGWHERTDDNEPKYRAIMSLKEEMKLEKIFQEHK